MLCFVYYCLFVCWSFSFVAMALSVYFWYMSLNVPWYLLPLFYTVFRHMLVYVVGFGGRKGRLYKYCSIFKMALKSWTKRLLKFVRSWTRNNLNGDYFTTNFSYDWTKTKKLWLTISVQTHMFRCYLRRTFYN